MSDTGGLRGADTREGGRPSMGCGSPTRMRTVCPHRGSPTQGAEAQWGEVDVHAGRLPRAGQEGRYPAKGQADGVRRPRSGDLLRKAIQPGARSPSG